MVYSSFGVGEVSRYSRHGLHSRLNGPSEGNGRSHRRQCRCVNWLFFEDDFGLVGALCAMSLSFLIMSSLGHARTRRHANTVKCPTAGTTLTGVSKA
jgi:hypothetical protein